MQEPTTHNQETKPLAAFSVEHIMSALAYLGVLVFIPLLLGGDSDTLRHHLKQGILLFIIGVVTSLAAWIWLPLWVLVNLPVVAVSLYGAVKALQGERWMVPGIGKYASRVKL